jgi:hypothetical protein
LAYLWIISQGIAILATKQSYLIDRSDRVDKSLFRLGLDWIKYALKKNLDFEPFFHFQTFESFVNVR